MKFKTRTLKAFLVLATVETLSMVMLATAARTEPIQPEQNLRSSLVTLLAQFSKGNTSEQNLRNSLVALLAQSSEGNTSEQNLRNSLIALLAQSNEGNTSEQNLRNSLIALLAQSTDTKASATEQNLRNSLVVLLTKPGEGKASATEQNLRNSLVALLTKPSEAQASEQNLRNSLVTLLAQPSDAKLSAEEKSLRTYLMALLAQPSDAKLSAAEQSLRNSLVALLAQPSDANLAIEQKYSNYLVALRGESSQAEQSQSQVDAKNPGATNTVSTQLEILSPAPDTVLDVQAATVTVQYPLGSQVEVRVNGVLVDSSLIGGTETNNAIKLVTQTWYGVSLKEGENTITAQTTTNGKAGQATEVKVQVRGAAQQLDVQTLETRIPADGRSTATVQGQLLDKKGNLSNRDAVVTLAASAGEFVGADLKPDQPGFQVQAQQGKFTASLRSSLNAQTVRIRATSGKLEAFTQFQFETNLRPSIVTGVVNLRLGRRGTDYYGSFRDFLPPDDDNKTQLDFNSAVFATGKIGDWLFTGAYNSDRNLNQNCDGTTSLYRQDNQFCDRNYPVYGDSSKVENLTPSQDSLYLRFERSARIRGADPDYAMWGDYNTQEFSRRSQEFTATNRLFHGFKANYNIGNLQVTGFYGNNVDGFQRDTIAPDGTGGYYFLSRRLLVPGSEIVFIELEELARPGTVIERKQLSRGTDYEIDYDRGTLLFRQPLLRTAVNANGDVLVRRIVSTYQYESKENSNIYGGRLQYNFSHELNRESWLGATYIKENQGVRDFELYGADALISIGPKSHLIAEYAHSSNDSELRGQ